ncbi:hypothetical protein AGMMS50229_19130 [Campylobacterota bacterium]|nr:hypothetical protein AGMMS50229_19130 [Campylobacterota bacterium]
MASEHIASALLKEAALLMANAHSANEEYLLANFYLDEYLKRYGDRENNDWINYLKLYADYRGFKQPLRNQKLLLDSIVRCEDYVARFGESELEIFVQTLMTKLRLANAELSGNISSLYRRLDKDDAAALYAKKGEFAPIDEGEYEGARRLWIRQIFE